MKIAAALDCQSVADSVAKLLMNRSPSEDIGFAAGSAGALTFLTQYWRLTRRAEAAESILREIDNIYEHLPRKVRSADTFNGYPGSCWAVFNALREFQSEGEAYKDSFGEVISCLRGHLQRDFLGGHFDVVCGLSGVGLLALDLPRNDDTDALVTDIYERLLERITSDSLGTYWRTPNMLILNQEERVRYPDGNINLGLAHGVPGAVLFLARACERKRLADQAKKVLQKCCDFLIAQVRQADVDTSAFGYLHGDRRTSRLAWCYGDLSCAWVLLQAAIALDSQRYQQVALAVVDATLRRSRLSSQVADAALCHGAAGLSHLYARIFQLTGDVSHQRAADTWWGITLEFLSVGSDDLTDGLLVGRVGIGCVAIERLHPAAASRWDALLL